jgi:hypothetical protein
VAPKSGEWKETSSFSPTDLLVVGELAREAFARIFEAYLGHPSPRRVERDIGDGVLWYEGVQARDAPDATMWRFSMYGGIWIGEPNVPGVVARRIGVITGPRLIRELADRAIRFEVRQL